MNYANLLLQILDLAAVSALTVERAIALRDQLKEMIAEGRDPTPEEWAALRDQGIQLNDRLDAAADRLSE